MLSTPSFLLVTGTEELKPSQPLRPGVECHCIAMSKPL
jgi:hypothetical protein